MLSGSIRLTQVAVSTPFDNSTDGWVANNVQAAIEEAPIHLRGAQAALTSAFTFSTAGTVFAMPGLTYTVPATGTYLVMFTGAGEVALAGNTLTLGIYLAGTVVANTSRTIAPFDGGALSAGNAISGVASTWIVTATTSQVITIQGSSSANTSILNSGALVVLRLT